MVLDYLNYSSIEFVFLHFSCIFMMKVSHNKKTCCVCGRICGKNSVPIHGLPNDEIIRKQWITFLVENGAARETDNFTRAYICGDHFPPLSYRTDGRHLKKWAVPCILERDIASFKPVEVDCELIDDSDILNNFSSDSKDCWDQDFFYISSDAQHVGIDKVEVLAAMDTDADSRQSSRHVGIGEIEVVPVINLVDPLSINTGQPTASTTSRSRSNKARYRYVADFKAEDMVDPVKAIKCRTIAIKETTCLRKKIILLRQSNRRLNKKIKALKALTGYSKKKNLISNDAE
ncbi:uncharacterized protein LOC132705659 isoform X1 [Cylas formicarius]|uniref:uncharacterized protein LOC132705659 isoform X1 n=1 Tax=Cylas formicarius TaxID=197179 RepID=UPI002958BECF|nr:uncharacterized protein LOC132705659 isoform X1 [Cylas formicarius]